MNQSKHIDISVVIPCFNETEVLPELFSRLARAADQWGVSYEVITVDDGSVDGTWDMLKAQHARDPRWRCISFSRNFGHQLAVSAGLYHAAGDAAVIMDADLQDPPEEVGRLIEKWREGYQVVYGVRTSRNDSVMMKTMCWIFYRLMTGLASLNVPMDSGDFCILDRRVLDVINAMPERNRFLRGLRVWSGFKQIGVEFERQARAAGTPQMSMKKLIRLAMDGFFSFSVVPLRLTSYLGLLISLVALAGVLFTFFQRIFRAYLVPFGLAPLPGFATIVISILFLGGVQLIFLGILGEYIGRIYDEVKGRPLWIIRESSGLDVAALPGGSHHGFHA